MNTNIRFCQLLLKATMEAIKPLTTVAERKVAWVYNFARDHWEFHGIDGFYWHGSADNAYDARHKGWEAWLEKLRADHNELKARTEAARHRILRSASQGLHEKRSAP